MRESGLRGLFCLDEWPSLTPSPPLSQRPRPAQRAAAAATGPASPEGQATSDDATRQALRFFFSPEVTLTTLKTSRYGLAESGVFCFSPRSLPLTLPLSLSSRVAGGADSRIRAGRGVHVCRRAEPRRHEVRDNPGYIASYIAYII